VIPQHEQLLALLEQASESAAVLVQRMAGSAEYIRRVPFTEGDALRSVASRASDLVEDLARVRRRLTATTRKGKG